METESDATFSTRGRDMSYDDWSEEDRDAWGDIKCELDREERGPNPAPRWPPLYVEISKTALEEIRTALRMARPLHERTLVRRPDQPTRVTLKAIDDALLRIQLCLVSQPAKEGSTNGQE